MLFVVSFKKHQNTFISKTGITLYPLHSLFDKKSIFFITMNLFLYRMVLHSFNFFVILVSFEIYNHLLFSIQLNSPYLYSSVSQQMSSQATLQEVIIIQCLI